MSDKIANVCLQEADLNVSWMAPERYERVRIRANS